MSLPCCQARGRYLEAPVLHRLPDDEEEERDVTSDSDHEDPANIEDVNLGSEKRGGIVITRQVNNVSIKSNNEKSKKTPINLKKSSSTQTKNSKKTSDRRIRNNEQSISR